MLQFYKFKSNLKSQAAFTFIELMIAITIFAVISAALYSTFGAGIRVWREGEKSLAFNQDMRLVLNDIDFELKNSTSYKAEDPVLNFKGDSSSIKFLTILDSADTTKLFVISYFTKEENGIINLKRLQADQSTGFEQDESKAETVLTNLSEIKFLYAFDSKDETNPYEWREAWDDGKITPRCVKLSVKFKNLGEESLLNLFTKTIFIPTGELGEKL